MHFVKIILFFEIAVERKEKREREENCRNKTSKNLNDESDFEFLPPLKLFQVNVSV
jgi:hypothetical protein